MDINAAYYVAEIRPLRLLRTIQDAGPEPVTIGSSRFDLADRYATKAEALAAIEAYGAAGGPSRVLYIDEAGHPNLAHY